MHFLMAGFIGYIYFFYINISSIVFIQYFCRTYSKAICDQGTLKFILIVLHLQSLGLIHSVCQSQEMENSLPHVWSLATGDDLIFIWIYFLKETHFGYFFHYISYICCQVYYSLCNENKSYARNQLLVYYGLTDRSSNISQAPSYLLLYYYMLFIFKILFILFLI